MTASTDPHRAKILIVDNQAGNILLLERTLRGAGYLSLTSTTEASDARELHRKNQYDLILLDLEMPGIDGFQVMNSLKEVEARSPLPVLVITSQADHMARALKDGAKDFISKPFTSDTILVRVGNFLENRLPATANRSRFDCQTVPQAIAWVVATGLGLWLVFQLWRVLLIVVVALVVAGTFNPIIKAVVARGYKRRTVLISLTLSLGLGVALLGFLTVPPLIDQLAVTVNDLPAQRDRLITFLGRYNLTASVGHALSNMELQPAIAHIRAYLIGYWAQAVRVIGYGVSALTISFYFLADDRRTQGALYSLVPRTHHMRLARIVFNLETIVGGYMRGQLITSVALGTFTFVLLTICGAHNALALALLAALLDVIPFIGGGLATSAAFFTTLSHGPNTAIAVLVCMCLYLQFENKVLVPRVYGHVLRLSPAAVILALLAGGTFLGVLGALLALPIAAGLRMVLEELGVGMPGDDSHNSVTLAQNRKTEVAYGLMSAGASPPDAGQIANELAQGVRDADAWVAANEAKKRGAEKAAGK